jgi:hypothetical protein
MAKYYFRLILLVGGIIGFFALVGSLLPRSYSFTSEIEVDADAASLFPRINSPQNWQEWSRQWNPDEIDGLEIQYNGIPMGVGAAQSWNDVRGSGKLWITESVPDQSIEYEMTFGNFPKMTSQIELVPGASTTRVRWSSQGKLPGGPFYGYFGFLFSTQMKSQYEQSLEELKSVAEAAPGG